jgi:hypothetical protein
MSTETLEAPKEVIDQKAIESKPPSKEEKDAILASLMRPKVDSIPAIQQPPEVKKEPVKEAAKEPVKDAIQTDADKNFAALRIKSEAAEKAAQEATAERDRLREEYENFKKQPVPKEYEERLTKAEQDRAALHNELRTVALSRDPEFQARYNAPIKASMEQMVAVAIQSGVSKEEATKAVTSWNEQAFAEWMDSGMDSISKLKFGAAMQHAITLDNQKNQELAQSEQTWQQLQKQREEQQKAQAEGWQKQLAQDVEAAVKETRETELAKLHPDALDATAELIKRAAGLSGERLSNREVFKIIGDAQLVRKGFDKQAETITQRDARIAELEKTLEERDSFIKEKHGGIPAISGSVSPSKTEDKKAIANQFLNPKIG